MLQSQVKINLISSAWETEAEGSSGPNFVNLCLQIETDLSSKQLKCDVARRIEAQLGRKRTSDKNASRTVDIDIIIFDDIILTPQLWTKSYLALPCSEIYPDIIDSENGKKLTEIADQISNNIYTKKFPDFINNVPHKC